VRSIGSVEVRVREVAEELRTVLLGRVGLIDAFLPALAFLVLNALAGPQPAVWGALIIGSSLAAIRLARRQSFLFALAGAGVSLLAAVSAGWLQRADIFFLPDVLTHAALAVISLGTLLLGRPLAAWTSHLVRRWPRGWYWQPRVRPAYAEVTLAWAVYFAAQSAIQVLIIRQQDPGLMAVASLAGGWPATIGLLVLSYLYGTWRLSRLGGPSVDEFVRQSRPPWQGQKRGF